MLRTILVPIDGSPFSERALTLAVPLAIQHNSGIKLTTSIALPPKPGDQSGARIPDSTLDSDIRTELGKHLDRVTRRVAKKYGVSTTSDFRDGNAVDQIEDVAKESNSDLIVMATHGRGGVSRLWIGSVTDALLRRSSIPVLVTRSARKWTKTSASEPLFPRILVAVDGSELSETALESTLKLVGNQASEIVLFRVQDTPVASISPTLIAQAIEEMETDYLEPLAKRYRDRGLNIRTRAVVHADPARAILEVAREELVYLTVVSTHGRTGVKRAALGSVADKVVRGSLGPVLVCPSIS